MEIKRLSDQMISESFAKHAKTYIYCQLQKYFTSIFAMEKNEHSGRKSLRQMDSN